MNITTYNSGTYHLIQSLAGRYNPPRRPLWPYILVLLGALAIAWPSLANAEDSSPFRTDLVAHFGTSATINTAFYGAFSRGLGMPRSVACGFAATLTTFVGLVKEMNDSRPDEADLWSNLAGTVTSNLLILGFEF